MAATNSNRSENRLVIACSRIVCSLNFRCLSIIGVNAFVPVLVVLVTLVALVAVAVAEDDTSECAVASSDTSGRSNESLTSADRVAEKSSNKLGQCVYTQTTDNHYMQQTSIASTKTYIHAFIHEKLKNI